MEMETAGVIRPSKESICLTSSDRYQEGRLTKVMHKVQKAYLLQHKRCIPAAQNRGPGGSGARKVFLNT